MALADRRFIQHLPGDECQVPRGFHRRAVGEGRVECDHDIASCRQGVEIDVVRCVAGLPVGDPGYDIRGQRCAVRHRIGRIEQQEVAARPEQPPSPGRRCIGLESRREQEQVLPCRRTT